MNDAIAIECRGFKICRRQVKKVLKTLRERAPWEFPAGWLSVAFVDDGTTCKLHEQFLDDPSKTDVITFPGDDVFTEPKRRKLTGTPRKSDIGDASGFAGEIVVCVPQAMRAAEEIGTTPADEILLYLVHGWLHLAGLDDLAEDTRRQMRVAEAEALEILRHAGAAPFTRISFPQVFD